MTRSKAEKEAQERYEASGIIKRKTLKLHKVIDADILDKLNATKNVNGYLKDLIRDDIKKQG